MTNWFCIIIFIAMWHLLHILCAQMYSFRMEQCSFAEHIYKKHQLSSVNCKLLTTFLKR